jgi:queuine tRNA-ribosyltransferase
LHAFLGWPRAILTDSGGFQVMSLSSRRRLTEEGVEFRSPEDGTRHFLTPELAVLLQSEFGVDIAMTLDVCPPFPAERREVEAACRLSALWAERSRRNWPGADEGALLFGIVQGGTHEDLRRTAAARLVDLDFDGYAIGGVAVGEPKEAIRAITASTAPLLPEEKPRYLMGVGTPADLLASVRAGVDLFDCVLPTRNGRMGHAYTRAGEVTIKHERFKEDLSPLDPECGCPVCRRHSRAYLRHLFVLGDFSAPMLLSLHNVFFYLAWMKRIRMAIGEGALSRLEAPPEGKIS